MKLKELTPVAEAENLLKAMASKRRLMILSELREREMTVSGLKTALNVGQSALSQHLARLRADRLVETRRVAQTIYYRVENPNVARVMGALCDSFSDLSASRRREGESMAKPAE